MAPATARSIASGWNGCRNRSAAEAAGLSVRYRQGARGPRRGDLAAILRRLPRLRRSQTGQPIPIDKVRTDRHRFNSWTTQARDGFNGLDDYDWRYSHFRKTSGYMAQALDGLWARAPYLHNGSVPTLADLLQPAGQAPDDVRGRLRRLRPVACRLRERRRRCAGARPHVRHAAAGQRQWRPCLRHDLPEADKQALLEYLKTL